MSTHTDDDMDDALRTWGDAARRSDGDAVPPSIADLLAERRRHRTLGAVAASVVLVVALAVGLGFGLRPAHRTVSAAPGKAGQSTVEHGPEVHRGCASRFSDAGTSVDAAQSAAIVVLRYTGTTTCRVFERPQIALVNSAGVVTGPHAPTATFNPVTSVRPGETIRFRADVEKKCLHVAAGHYSLLVSLRPSFSPSPSTGIEVGHGRLRLGSSELYCKAAQAASTSRLQVVSTHEASTLSRLARIARREAVSDGDPTATAEAVRTTYGQVERTILNSVTTRSSHDVVWVVQLHGNFSQREAGSSTGPSGVTIDYVDLVLQEPQLRYSDSLHTDQHHDLSGLGSPVPLIP